MSISFSGLASGLDTTSWVESLTALKRAKVETLKEEKENILLSRETLNSIKSFFSSFRSVLEKVTDAKFGMVNTDIFAQKLAISSNTSVLTATATTEAEEATYNVEVNKLANNTQAASAIKAYTTITQSVTASLDTKLSALGVKSGNLGVTVNGNANVIEINENDTLGSFIGKLKNIGVDASFNEKTGVFTVNADDSAFNDTLTTQADGSVGTGIVDALNLREIGGYESSFLQSSTVETIVSAATGATKLGELGDVNAGDIVVKVDGADQNLHIDENTTLQELVDGLKNLGVDAELTNSGELFIRGAEITDPNGTNILEALGLTTNVNSNTQTAGNLQNATVVTTSTSATSGTKIGELDGWNGSDSVLTVINANGVTTNITMTSDMTLNELVTDLNNAGLNASLESDGTLNISGGVVGGAGAGVLGIDTGTVNKVTQSGASTILQTLTAYATGDTKLSDLGITDETLEVYDSSSNAVATISATSTSTINDLFDTLSDYGVSGTITDGVITLTSSNGSYVNGTMAEKLGIGLQTSGGSTTVGINLTSTLALSKTATVTATGSSKISDFVTLDNPVITFKKSGTSFSSTYTIFSDTTFDDLINKCAEVGITATLNDGVLSFTSTDGYYIQDSAQMSQLGIHTQTISDTRTTTPITVTSNAPITYTISGDLTLDTTIGNVLDGNSWLLYVENSADASTDATITVTSTMTFANLQSELSTYGLNMSINSNGTLSLTDSSGYSRYVTGSFADAVGWETVTTTQTVGSSVTGNVVYETITTDEGTVTVTVATSVSSGNSLEYQSVHTEFTTLTVSSMQTSGALTYQSISTQITDGTTTTYQTTTVGLSQSGNAITYDSVSYNTTYVTTTVGKSQTSNTLTYTLTNTTTTTTTFTVALSQTGGTIYTNSGSIASETTTFREIGFGSTETSSLLIRGENGAAYTLNIEATMPLKVFLEQLKIHGVSATFSNGMISINGDTSTSYIESEISDISLVARYLQLNFGSSWSYTAEEEQNYTTTTVTGTATGSDPLKGLLISKGYNGEIKMTLSDGRELTIPPSYTMQNFVTWLNDMGVTASLSDGKLTIGSETDSVCITSCDALPYLGISVGENNSYRLVSTPQVSTVTTQTTATERTNISYLGEYSNYYYTYVDESGIEHTSTIASSDNHTIASVVEALNYSGINATYDGEVGVLSITGGSSYIKSMDAGLANILGLSIGEGSSYRTNITTTVTDMTETLTVTTTVTATEDTTFGTLGLTGAPIFTVVDSDGVEYNYTVHSSSTLGDFRDFLNSHDVSVSINGGGYISIYGGYGHIKSIDTTGSNWNELVKISGGRYFTTVTGSSTTAYTTVTEDIRIGAHMGNSYGFNGTIKVVSSDGSTQNVALSSNETYGDLIDKLADVGVTASLTNGVFTLGSTSDTSYVKSMDSWMPGALGLSSGSNYTTTAQSVTTTSTVTISSTTTLRDLGLGDSFYYFTAVVDGATASERFSITSSTTVGDFISYVEDLGFTASLSNGRLTITGDDSHYIYGTEIAFARALGIQSAAGGSYGNYLTNSNTDSDVLGASRVESLSGSTKLVNLGFSTGSKNLLDTESGYIYFTITSNSTVNDMCNWLASEGISATVSDSKLSLNASDGNAITWMNGDFFRTFKLNYGEGGTYTSIGKLTIGNTNSNKQERVAVTNADANTTLGELGFSGNGTIVTENSSGNKSTFVVDSTTKLGDLPNYANVNGGKLTLNSDSSNYVYSISPNLTNFLGFSGSGEGYTYQVQGNTSYSNIATKTLCSASTYADRSTKFAELGISSFDANIIDKNGNTLLSFGSQLNANSTLGDFFDILGANGINADINDGKITLTSTNGNCVTGTLAEALGIGVDGTLTAVGVILTGKNPLTYTTNASVDSNTTFANLGIDVSNRVLEIRSKEDGALVATIKMANTSSLGNLFANLEGQGITATLNNGVITLTSDTKYVSGSLAYALGIEVNDTTYSNSASKTLKNSTTITTVATNGTKLADIHGLNVGNGKIAVHKEDGSIETITIRATDSLGNFFYEISAYGFSGSISATGNVTINSPSGAYLEVVGENTSTTVTVNATATLATTFAELGATGDMTVTMRLDGNDKKTKTIKTTDTIGDFIKTLKATGYVLSATMVDGNLSFVCQNGYSVAGEAADFLGITSHSMETNRNITTGYSFVRSKNDSSATGTSKVSNDGEFKQSFSEIDTSVLTALSSLNVNTDTLSAGSTYSISTTDELISLKDWVANDKIADDVTFVLANDIDMNGINWSVGIGTSAHKFSAKFNGNGFDIKNLQGASGVFNFVDNAEILNLGVYGTISLASDTNSSIGLLANNVFSSSVDNCFVVGEINDEDLEGVVGGLIGQANAVVVNNSYADVSMTIAPVGGYEVAAGGLIGDGINLNIKDSYTSGNITNYWVGSGAYVGGIVGSSSGGLLTITNVYSDLNMIDRTGGYSEIHGIVGSHGASLSLSNVYYAGDSGTMDSDEVFTSKTEYNALCGYSSSYINYFDRVRTNGSEIVHYGSVSQSYLGKNDQLGLSTNFQAGDIVVYNLNNNTYNTINVTASMTVNDLCQSLSDLGVQAYYDTTSGNLVVRDSGDVFVDASSTFVEITASQNVTVPISETSVPITYTKETVQENRCNIPELLESTPGAVQTIYSNTTSDTALTKAVSSGATGSNKLEDIEFSDGSKLVFDASGNASLVASTTSKDGSTQTTTFNFSKTQTLEDVISALESIGITATLDSNGKFSLSSETLNDFDLSGEIADKLFGSNAKQYDISVSLNQNNTTTTTVAATRDTLLSDLGVTTGEYYIYQNGVKYTAMISSDETLGSFMDKLNTFGIQTSLVTDGTSSKLVITGSGNSYVAKSNSESNASNVVDKLFGENSVDSKYDYTGSENLSSTITTTATATLDTLLKNFDTPWGDTTLKSAGRLVFSVDGESKSIQITSDETFGSLIEKLNDAGVEAMFADGKLYVSDAHNFSVNTLATTSSIINPNATIHLNHKDAIDGFMESSEKIATTNTIVEESTISAANYAGYDTKLDLLNISNGTFTLYRDGIKAEINIKSEDTFSDLRAQIASKFSDVDLKFDDGKLVIYSKTDGVKIEAGTTTDTSNFQAITGLAKAEDNSICSTRRLYCVNSSSLVTQAGLFREGNVTEGTFTVGNQLITIDDKTTIADIVSQINTSDKTNATAFWDSIDGKLVIQSRTSGNALINIEAGTSNFTDILGFTESEWNDDNSLKKTALNVSRQELGGNARVTINGTAFTSTSNTLTSDVTRIKGVTINLKGLTEGSAVQIKVEKDTEVLTETMDEVVSAYNELMDNVDKAIAINGQLHDQTMLKMMRNRIRDYMTSSVGTSSLFKNLDSIGVSVSAASAGNISTANSSIVHLGFDKEKFAKAINTDLNGVKELLVGSGDKDGVFVKVETLLENALQGVTGYFDIAEKSYKQEAEKLENKITKANRSIERYKAQLEKKFSSMDMIISNAQQQYSTFLS